MRVKYARGCTCGKRMVFEPHVCLWCGRGQYKLDVIREVPRLRRLPWDLGALQREGRRPDPHLDNVVRLDRLRDAWKVPPAPAVEPDEVPLTSQQRRCLALAAEGLSNEQIAAVIGRSPGVVSVHLSNAYATLGLSGLGVGRTSPARRQAVEWWRSVHSGELAA
jgi:DNA-binding CsgD family transcriptional regulator